MAIKGLYRETAAYINQEVRVGGWVRMAQVSKTLVLLRLMMRLF